MPISLSARLELTNTLEHFRDPWQLLTSGFVHAPWIHNNFISSEAVDSSFDLTFGKDSGIL